MLYLDAALAFALTMLAVSTLVTQLVRFLQHVWKIRNQFLQEMLNVYFTQDLLPVINRELSRLKKDLSAEVAQAICEKAQALSVNVVFPEPELATFTEVSTEELLERLKRNPVGIQLLENLGDKAQTVFNELGKRYETVGNHFTEIFRYNSRLATTILAILVAFILNVDSLFVLDTYVKNEDMRRAVIAQQASLQDGYLMLSNQLTEDSSKASITRAEFEQAFGDAKTQLDAFTSAGFPVGFSYFPYACLENTGLSACENRHILLWIVGCILTGLLAGLGAPFWYDAVTGLSRAIQTMRAEKKPEAQA